MLARTSAAVVPKAAKCFKFLDVILRSPFCLIIDVGFGRCLTIDGMVKLPAFFP